MQRGPTSFDLRAILQKRENLRAISNKAMFKTTVSQDLKLKMEDKWVRHWNYFTTANSQLIQIPISGMPVINSDFGRATVFDLGHRLSKHKTTKYEILGRVIALCAPLWYANPFSDTIVPISNPIC